MSRVVLTAAKLKLETTLLLDRVNDCHSIRLACLWLCWRKRGTVEISVHFFGIKFSEHTSKPRC